jgi:hypothetical protein
MGSSAGGHLAARVSTGFDIQTYQEVDELDAVSCKPDFTVLLYPAYMNKGKQLSEEFSVSNKISPTLIVYSQRRRLFSRKSNLCRSSEKKPVHPFVSTFLRRAVTDSPFGLKSTRFPLGRIFVCNGSETRTLLKKPNKRMHLTRNSSNAVR